MLRHFKGSIVSHKLNSFSFSYRYLIPPIKLLKNLEVTVNK